MLPSPNLPVSLLGVLMTVRPCFTAPTFTTFCGLAGQVRRRTVCGMLLGACLRWPHDRAHYFFSGPAGSWTRSGSRWHSWS
jgi:hypothetical protein